MNLKHAMCGVALLALASFATPLACAAVDTSGPFELIDSASKTMLQALDAHRDEYRKDPTKLHKLVDDTLLPHFDTEYSAKLVLAQNWRTATPEQRSRFVAAFYHSLLRTYGDALLDFTADRMKVFPVKVEPGAERATVRTEVKRNSGDRVPVNYSLRKTPDGWKAWDVTIEGISYVKSFREDFYAEISKDGIEALIKRLESGTVHPSAAAKSAEAVKQ
jgi:phospholipid transport system substrate-binding protein